MPESLSMLGGGGQESDSTEHSNAYRLNRNPGLDTRLLLRNLNKVTVARKPYYSLYEP